MKCKTCGHIENYHYGWKSNCFKDDCNCDRFIPEDSRLRAKVRQEEGKSSLKSDTSLLSTSSSFQPLTKSLWYAPQEIKSAPNGLKQDVINWDKNQLTNNIDILDFNKLIDKWFPIVEKKE